ncbi:hypothetical protein H6P81_020778 [Aristolochia fimbriata]|uniref:Uncharacterized protein n=1 Tax=Aristolochia fimbriata TaxID=158543 RepID=A0AAV7DZM3_ARIFI|nr:hypothetical protein H6P81_020778 [Aristolochia fimbriata]
MGEGKPMNGGGSREVELGPVISPRLQKVGAVEEFADCSGFHAKAHSVFGTDRSYRIVAHSCTKLQTTKPPLFSFSIFNSSAAVAAAAAGVVAAAGELKFATPTGGELGSARLSQTEGPTWARVGPTRTVCERRA